MALPSLVLLAAQRAQPYRQGRPGREHLSTRGRSLEDRGPRGSALGPAACPENSGAGPLGSCGLLRNPRAANY